MTCDLVASDAAAGVAVVGAFGLMLLMAAFDGRSLLFERLTIKQRWSGLFAANVIISSAFVVAYGLRRVTPVDIWHGAILWWHGGSAFCWIIAVVAWWTLLSPIMSLVTIFNIRRTVIKQRRIRYFSS